MKTIGRMVPYLIRMMGKKADTELYPSVPAHVPEHFRGALQFHGDRCVGCKLCVRVCPAAALEIEKAEDRFKAVVHMDKCIFCGQCVYSCHKNALENTRAFELASADKASLRVEM